MRIYQIILTILFLTTGCSTGRQQLYSNIAPDWVNTLRTGDSTLKVKNGEKYLFRTNHKKVGQNREKACSSAIDKNIEYIKTAYPFIEQIPMTVELVFFDPNINDCSTTISISADFIDKADGLKAMQASYKNALIKLDGKKKMLTKKIKGLQSEKRKSIVKIRQLQNFINKNAHLLKAANDLDSKVTKIISMIQNLNDRAKNYIVNGMTLGDVNKIFHKKVYRTFSTDSSCYRYFRTSKISRVGTYEICWTDSYSNNVVMGYCSATKKKCWHRTPE
ncbi:MAG: hypothetical protein KAG61_12320 [Bacteriovoracaceae bacterium]|nr:hypothetical protein [Bacteriovoracaceae bacterium]